MLKNLEFEEFENFFVITSYFCNKQCLNFSCEQFVLHFCKKGIIIAFKFIC